MSEDIGHQQMIVIRVEKPHSILSRASWMELDLGRLLLFGTRKRADKSLSDIITTSSQSLGGTKVEAETSESKSATRRGRARGECVGECVKADNKYRLGRHVVY
jgi:hypothetical protein